MTDFADGDFESAVLPFLEKHAPGGGRIAIRKFGTGQSNPTYLVERGGVSSVLRTKPPGRLLRSAHLVEREFRVMKALKGSDVPVPEMIALADDRASPTGRACFLMERVEGRVFYDPLLPELERAERRSVYDQMNQVLAALHELDPAESELSDFGKPGDYFARQARRWTEQYLASRMKPDANMDRLIEWLASNLPPDDGQAAIVHGDYRLDNMIFAGDPPIVRALIDWELSTLGHPMADLAYQCMQWRLPHDARPPGLGAADRAGLGLPEEREYVECYCQTRSAPFPENWTFYLVFAFFRFAAILEGVARRASDGNASNPEAAAEYGRTAPVLARMAVEIMESEG